MTEEYLKEIHDDYLKEIHEEINRWLLEINSLCHKQNPNSAMNNLVASTNREGESLKDVTLAEVYVET